MNRPSEEGLEEGFSQRRIDVGELVLHVVEAGPEEGPLVVLLHGFPEHWWSWRHQIGALAAAGFRVAAPDLRGYNLSDRPAGIAAYAMPRLVGDVAGLIAALGRKRAHIVGHDWGGGIAWAFAGQRPELTERLVAMNCPHPLDLVRGLRDPRQLLRSWYMLFFQIPGLAERLLMARNARALRNAFERRTPEEIERFVEAARRGGGLVGPINYYRAAARSLLGGQLQRRRIEAPTLVIWGREDHVLGEALAYPDEQWVPGARVELIEGAGHDVQLDAPERVSALLIAHLTGTER